MEKQEVSLAELKGHPFFDQVLAFNGQKAFYDFVEMVTNKKNLTNKDYDNSTVFKVLDLMIEDEEASYHKIISTGTELFRCRKINQAKEIATGGIDANYTEENEFFSRGYDEPNSKEAPHGKAGAARANYDGIPYLYLAEEPYTACAEIRPDNHSFVSLAKFRIENDARILDLTLKGEDCDLTKDYSEFEKANELSIITLITEIRRFFATPNVGGAVYPVTQLISDHVRKAGFDGVRFQSSVSGGNNITLFNCHRSRVRFVDSKVIYVHTMKYTIIDLDDGKKIESPVISEWDDKYISYRREELIRKVLNTKKTE